MSGPGQQQFNPGNQRFTSGEELRVYLEGLDPDYVSYTDKLWRANYTSIRKLANADTAHLVQAGVVVADATDIVKASGAALAVATGAGAGPSGAGGAAGVSDTTKSFLQSLQGYPEELQQGWPVTPSAAELAGRLQGFLMRKDGTLAQLPVVDTVYLKLVAVDPDLKQLLQPVSQCGAGALSALVSAALQVNMSAPSDEIVLAGYVDKLVWDILDLTARTLHTQSFTRKRNSTEHSLTSPKLKPDFLLLVQQTLLMKGEDKTGDGDLGVAKQELCDKLKQWSARYHGLIEFLICYAAAGLTLQFCAVGRESPTPRLVNLGPPWDFSQPFNRARVMMCVMMLFPVLMSQLEQLPCTNMHGLGQTVIRPNGTAITFWDDYVEKTISPHTLVDSAAMAIVYDAAKNCPQLVQLRPGTRVVIRGDSYRVFLTPLGRELSTRHPPQGTTLRHAIRCVLMALKWLHMRGWGHADIRWENIIQETDQAYRLIDLECAVRLGTDCSARKPAPHAWGQYNEALVGGCFTEQSDLFMVGRLMQQASATASGGQSLMAALLGKTIAVDDALSDGWFVAE